MPKYRKKPVEIEATQWFKHGDHPEVKPFDLPESRTITVTDPTTTSKTTNNWNTCRNCGKLQRNHGLIQTLMGEVKVCSGDWIIPVSTNNYRKMESVEFEATYEPAPERE